MKGFSIHLLPQAQREFLEAFDYYSLISPGLGERFENSSFELLNLIRKNPGLFQVIEKRSLNPSHMLLFMR